MTKDEALTLEAGLELDALVGEKVMGLPPRHWNVDTLCPECGGEMRFCGLRSRCLNCDEWKSSPYKDYSDDIEAAWEIVEKLNMLQFVLYRENCAGVRHDAEFYNRTDQGDRAHGEADTAPLAICRAALKATWPKQAGDTDGY